MKKNFLAALLALCLMLTFGPIPARAAGEGEGADGTSGTKKDPLMIDQLTSAASGSGWIYDPDTATLNLNGYDGGPILTERSLTILLAPGSTNKITAVYDPEDAVPVRTALGSNQFGYEETSLTIQGSQEGTEGTAKPILQITGDLQGIYTQGDLEIKNCEVRVNLLSTEKSKTAVSNGTMSSYVFCCVRAGGSLSADAVTFDLTSKEGGTASSRTYAGISGAQGAVTVENCGVTIDVETTGIQSSNELLTLKNSALDITAPRTAAIVCQHDAIQMEGCTGTLRSRGTNGVAITAQRTAGTITLTKCSLDLDATYYGILSNSNSVTLTDSEIGFPNSTTYGIYAGKDLNIQGTSTLRGENCSILGRAPNLETLEGHLDDNAEANGVFLYKGAVAFSGTLALDSAHAAALQSRFASGVSWAVLPGAQITIDTGAVLNTSAADRAEIQGTLVNRGTLNLPATAVTAAGFLDNGDEAGAVTVPQGVEVENAGRIRSICIHEIPVTEASAPVEYLHKWDAGNVTKPPTATQPGIRTYTCQWDPSHTYTEEIPVTDPEPTPTPGGDTTGGEEIRRDPYLRFDSNGGTKFDSIDGHGEEFSINVYDDHKYGAHIPARPGYRFTGWYRDRNLTRRVDEEELLRVRDVTTLFAGWAETSVPSMLNGDDHYAYIQGYSDGSVRPNQSMTRAEAAQMFYTLLRDKDVPATVTFSDVAADAWYAAAVNTLATLDVVGGVGDNLYEPERAITRAEFTAIVMGFADLGTGRESIFSDVHEQDWFHDVVLGAAQYGWIEGYPDGTFRPYANITRAEVTAVVNRMLGRSADAGYIERHTASLRQFSDLARSHWAYYDIAEAANGHSYRMNGGTEEWTGLD